MSAIVQPTVCPTIDAATEPEFRKQIESVAGFAARLHIDLADGKFTPQALISPDSVWWPGGVRADLHVMYKRPLAVLDTLIALGPQLVILHAEAEEGDVSAIAEKLRNHGIEMGIALLQPTAVELIAGALEWIDHVLVYSGSLGTFGGTADLSLLRKVTELKRLKPQLEIGWDGGVNAENARQLAAAGVEVLNAGGFIHHSANPHVAYDTLVAEAART